MYNSFAVLRNRDLHTPGFLRVWHTCVDPDTLAGMTMIYREHMAPCEWKRILTTKQMFQKWRQ